MGLSNKDIGKRLRISKYTVDSHLRSMYIKMDVQNRTELSFKLRNQLLIQDKPCESTASRCPLK